MREITNLDELKSIELDVMKKIHQFCEENKMDYYLSFGTLIGAVRHWGFIPWDDDIDIYMKRNDYEKFLKLFPTSSEKMGLGFANHLTHPYYGRCLTKVFDANTILIETQYKTDEPIGVFIDIWPLDGLPDNGLLRKVYLFLARVLKKAILASSMKNDPSFSFGKNCVIRFCSLLNPHKLVMRMDEMCKKYDVTQSKYIWCYAAQDAVYERGLFEKKILHTFEDTKFYIPTEYDQILKLEFGDYMQLPPKDQRVPHHVTNVFYK